MWRVGVLVVLSVIFAIEGAEHRYGPHLQRLKRSPHYDCPPFSGGGPPRFWPPPHRHHPFGPPPYWPPPPQVETNQQEQASQAQSSAQSGALTQKAGAQDGGPGIGPGIERGQDQGLERGQGQRGPSQGDGDPGNQPCDTCGGGQQSAVSNARSETGSAVAIAISGKNSGK